MPRKPTAQTLMDDFAQRTGIRSASHPQRYLWTDAFAVCNFLELSRRTGNANYCQLALQLVDQVHHVLGRHRPDDSRSGWISGLGEQEGEQHPTAGGLRIGKPLGERPPQESLDDRLEWDRDGQYFHYLTKWMHALHRVSQETGDERYGRWAIELGHAAHASFTYRPSEGRPKRMVWKMSIDLSRPLVASQGQHDPLDGLITYQLLCTTGPGLTADSAELETEIEDLACLCSSENWATADPLGLGGLLTDLYRVQQLQQVAETKPPELLAQIFEAVIPGLQVYTRQRPLQDAAAYRLGFRELGFSIGMRALERLQQAAGKDFQFAKETDWIMQHRPMADKIEAFWRQQENREADSWTAHRDINEVMLATSLAPAGYLGSSLVDSRSPNENRCRS